MKANELMIGDWVLVKGTPKKVRDIDDIDGINREWIAGCEDGGCIRWEDIKPVPLTSEILRANCLDNDGALFSCEEFCISKWRTNLFAFNKSWQRKYDPHEIVAKNITYVHELQHALRLCGIEKEIVL